MKKLNKEKLLEDIQCMGYVIESIDELIKMDSKDQRLVPIVISHLIELEDDSDKQFLVRCLGVKGFKEAVPTLLEEYKKSSNQSLKWTIGNTISIIDDASVLPEIMGIAQDKENGMSRQMIVIAIGQSRDKEALPLLKSLLSDTEVAGHAIMALAKYRMPELILDIQPLEQHSVKWIRNEARKAIKKLSR